MRFAVGWMAFLRTCFKKLVNIGCTSKRRLYRKLYSLRYATFATITAQTPSASAFPHTAENDRETATCLPWIRAQSAGRSGCYLSVCIYGHRTVRVFLLLHRLRQLGWNGTANCNVRRHRGQWGPVLRFAACASAWLQSTASDSEGVTPVEIKRHHYRILRNLGKLVSWIR